MDYKGISKEFKKLYEAEIIRWEENETFYFQLMQMIMDDNCIEMEFEGNEYIIKKYRKNKIIFYLRYELNDKKFKHDEWKYIMYYDSPTIMDKSDFISSILRLKPSYEIALTNKNFPLNFPISVMEAREKGYVYFNTKPILINFINATNKLKFGNHILSFLIFGAYNVGVYEFDIWSVFKVDEDNIILMYGYEKFIIFEVDDLLVILKEMSKI